jgi:hypothetical protein
MKSQIVDCFYRIDVRTVGEAPSIDRCRASCNIIYLSRVLCLSVCVCVCVSQFVAERSAILLVGLSNQTDQGDFS